MNPERAHEIVAAICDRFWMNMGLLEKPNVGSLGGVSLAEMLEATAAVRAENKRRQDEGSKAGTSYSFLMEPDDRLIAAVYALEHYPASSDAIVAMPHPQRPELALALVVGTCRMPSESDQAEGDDE